MEAKNRSRARKNIFFSRISQKKYITPWKYAFSRSKAVAVYAFLSTKTYGSSLALSYVPSENQVA